jgi:sirohydrochlorin ferrochelatase
MKRGLLLIDRGSKEREAEEELDIICKKIKEKANYEFTDYCFLEVVPPFINDGLEKCFKKDIDALTIVPYFLYPGKKVKAAVTETMKFQSKTKIKFIITKPMSMHQTLIDLVDSRITSALKKNDVEASRKNVDVLIIGHGSKDPNAKMSIDYIVSGLKKTYRNVERCFLEIEDPDIPAGIKTCEEKNPEVLVVVFYFLHEGAHVKTDINLDLKPAIEKSNLKKVCITEHIGTDDKMIDFILERAREVENAN